MDEATLGDFLKAGSSSNLQMKRSAQGEGRFLRESGLGVGAGAPACGGEGGPHSCWEQVERAGCSGQPPRPSPILPAAQDTGS